MRAQAPGFSRGLLTLVIYFSFAVVWVRIIVLLWNRLLAYLD